MPLVYLPVTSTLDRYAAQARQLLEDWKAGDAEALRFFHQHLPRLKDDKVRWKPKHLSQAELQAQVFDSDDARAAVAHAYDFVDWDALTQLVAAMERRDPAVYPFECAVDAVVEGDLSALDGWLKENPELVHARSARVTHNDPPVHRATLLHYVAANGTEGYRQRTPKNAVEIAKRLLDAGAEVDALASLYGGECTTLSLLVSSCHPAQAGVQAELAELLVSRGASLNDTGSGAWVSPVETALVFGYRDTAQTLARLGAPLSLPAAAGLGRSDLVAELLAGSDAMTRQRAMAMSTIAGHAETTRLLLDFGEDPNRYNPPGTHAHSTPLHQAAFAGHLEVVRLFVERGARLDLRDKIYDGTPLDWAEHGGQLEVVRYLRQRV